jgi:hypothetical protein
MDEQNRPFTRSGRNIVHSPISIKSWLLRVPTVDEARPGQCPVCAAASRSVGGPVCLWGHGLRERQLRGPQEPFGSPQTAVLLVRRYQCQRCAAIVTVVPQGVVPRRHYAAPAIALALVLFALRGLPENEVRARVSPWRVVGDAAQEGWSTLRRWCRAAQQGALFVPGFPDVRVCPADFTLRQVAERVAAALSSLAPPGMGEHGPEVRAFFGGGMMQQA